MSYTRFLARPLALGLALWLAAGSAMAAEPVAVGPVPVALAADDALFGAVAVPDDTARLLPALDPGN